MSVTNQEVFNSSTANGVTTTFPYTFRLLDTNDLVVMVGGVVVASGFTVTGVGDSGGGNIVFDTAPANGLEVLRKRVVPLQRLSDYQFEGDLSSSGLNREFDRIWQTLQQIAHDVKRAIKLAFTTDTEQEIPESAGERANKAIVFDDDGNLKLQAFDVDTQSALLAQQYADEAEGFRDEAEGFKDDAAASAAQAAVDGAAAGADAGLAAATALPGRLIDKQVFTTNGTWTKPSGLTANAIVIVEMVAGGAGGSGAKGASSQIMIGMGGMSGSYLKAALAASSLNATEAVVVGSAGTGGAATPTTGTAGGDSSFSDLTAKGGDSSGTVSSGTSAFSVPKSVKLTGHALVKAWQILSAVRGHQNPAVRISGTFAISCPGGDSPLGAGGNSPAMPGGDVGSNAPDGYGGGGGGAISSDATGYAGGNGRPGIVIVYTYG